jgi:RimJ/RimL family protein N-acetyltransferase
MYQNELWYFVVGSITFTNKQTTMRYLMEGQETERLLFRLLRTDDYDSWRPFFDSEESVRFMGLQHIPDPDDRCRQWFDIVLGRYENDKGGLNVLIDKKTKVFIGQCGLLIQEVDGKEELEIGYSLLPTYWKLGYATEAAIQCKKYAFESNFSDSLISIIHQENYRSIRVATKNGMKYEKHTVFKEMPVNIYRITKSDDAM